MDTRPVLFRHRLCFACRCTERCRTMCSLAGRCPRAEARTENADRFRVAVERTFLYSSNSNERRERACPEPGDCGHVSDHTGNPQVGDLRAAQLEKLPKISSFCAPSPSPSQRISPGVPDSRGTTSGTAISPARDSSLDIAPRAILAIPRKYLRCCRSGLTARRPSSSARAPFRDRARRPTSRRWG